VHLRSGQFVAVKHDSSIARYDRPIDRQARLCDQRQRPRKLWSPERVHSPGLSDRLGPELPPIRHTLTTVAGRQLKFADPQVCGADPSFAWGGLPRTTRLLRAVLLRASRQW